MKKAIIALSAILLASPVFAADTVSHATDETVAEAHKGADTAKEKLHKEQNKGEEAEAES
ncbi:opacity protein-like surface antigen [Ewingella americana]